MTMKTATETEQLSVWQKIYRWGKTLDKVANYDPAEHALEATRRLHLRVADLEAEMVHLKEQSTPRQIGGE